MRARLTHARMDPKKRDEKHRPIPFPNPHVLNSVDRQAPIILGRVVVAVAAAAAACIVERMGEVKS